MESALGKLTEYIKNKKYHKILYTIDRINKYGEDGQNSNTVNVYKEQLCILKMIIANDIQASLCSGREIPSAIWALVDWLGKDFMMSVGVVAVSFLLTRYAEDFRSKAAEIRSIDDVPKHFLWAERCILETANMHNDLPEDWCLHGMLVFLFCKETASVLEECCISTYDSSEVWVNAIKACVDFETKYTKSARCICTNTGSFDFGSKTGDTVIMFSGESVEVNVQASPIDSGIILERTAGQKEKSVCLCKSRKSISRVLSRNLAPYIKHLCADLSCINFDQEDHEMCIIRCFIAFFSILGRAHVRITHFDQNTFYSAFNAECDQHLCRYLDKLHVAAEYSRGVIVANSLIFVENTLRDFLHNNAAFFEDKYHEWDSFNRIRKLEAAQFDLLGKSVERIVMDINIDIDGYFGRHFAKALLETVFAMDTVYIYPELITFVLSESLSVLLFRISEIKMCVHRAEHILGEVGDIKSSLAQLKQKVHVFSTLEMYLKVYLVPPEDIENFVQNFILVSESKFVFTQILKRLENKRNNAKLYMCYRSKTKHAELLHKENIGF